MKELLDSMIVNHENSGSESIEQLPTKAFLHWFPQILKLAVHESLIS